MASADANTVRNAGDIYRMRVVVLNKLQRILNIDACNITLVPNSAFQIYQFAQKQIQSTDHIHLIGGLVASCFINIHHGLLNRIVAQGKDQTIRLKRR